MQLWGEKLKESYTIGSIFNSPLISQSQFHFTEMALDWESRDMDSISGPDPAINQICDFEQII